MGNKIDNDAVAQYSPKTPGKSRQPGAIETEDGPLAIVLAGLTRSFLLAAKSLLSKGIVKAALRKRAFLTIGQSVGGSKAKSPGSETAAFLKSSLHGLAVFGVYDVLIFRTWPQHHPRDREAPAENVNPVLTSERKPVWMQASVSPDGERTPVWAHFGAGAAAGVAQSAVTDTWELGSYWWNHRHRKKVSLQHHIRTGINHTFILRRLIHHTVGYATLFGCYELIRRTLVHGIYDYFASGAASVPITLDLLERFKLIHTTEREIYDMTIIPLSTAFLAGGLAGQLHFVVSHYSRHWKLQALNSCNHTKAPRRAIPKLPRFRSTASTFLPTALCFVAFQYGGELTERLVHEDSTRHPFPVYIFNPS